MNKEDRKDIQQAVEEGTYRAILRAAKAGLIGSREAVNDAVEFPHSEGDPENEEVLTSVSLREKLRAEEKP